MVLLYFFGNIRKHKYKMRKIYKIHNLQYLEKIVAGKLDLTLTSLRL